MVDGMKPTIITVAAEGSGGTSLPEARAEVRRLNAEGAGRDIDVELSPGVYYLSDPLLFEPADGGSVGHRVTYRAATPGEVVFFGGERIAGWRSIGGGVYSARVDDGRVFHSLSENGRRCRPARYPDEGYLRTVNRHSKEPKRRFGFGDDMPVLERPDTARVFIWSGGPKGEWNWASDTLPIETIDYDAREIVLRHETHYEIGVGSRFFVENDMALLTKPGEFFLHTGSSTVFYRPFAEPIEDQTVVAPRVRRVVEFSGAEGYPVRNVSLVGIEISTCDTTGTIRGGSIEHGAVHLEHAEGIEIAGCRIHHTGLHGVLITGASRRNTVRDSLIYDVGHTGVQINGPRLVRCYLSRGNLVTNNHIHHTGRTVGHGAGIQLSNSGNNTITHNLVHHTPRYAISIKGPRPGTIVGTTIEGIKVTRENAHEFIHSRNNTVAYNDMSRANLDSQDTGVFETWGPGRGNVLHNNRLHHSDIHFSFGFGVYLDDAANWMAVTNNIVDHLQASGEGTLWFPVFSKGLYNVFENNIVAENKARRAAFGSQEMAGEPNRQLSIRRNVFSNNAEATHGFISWTDDRYAVCDENLYYENSGKYAIDNHPDVADFDLWREYQNRRFDSRSVVSNPRFVDPENGDFRFEPTSPAYALGITDIDHYAIGLTEQFPFAPESPRPARLFVLLPTGGATITVGAGSRIVPDVRARTVEGYPVSPSLRELTIESLDEGVATVIDTTEGFAVRADARGVAELRIRHRTLTDLAPLRFWIKVV